MILQAFREKVTNLLGLIFDGFVLKPYIFSNLLDFVGDWLATYNLLELLLGKLFVIIALNGSDPKLVVVFPLEFWLFFQISNCMINPWFRILANIYNFFIVEIKLTSFFVLKFIKHSIVMQLSFLNKLYIFIIK